MSTGDGGGEVLNPVEVEQIIRATANGIGKSVKVVSEAHAAFKTKTRIYEHAFAVAYISAEGPSHEKKYRAEKVTQQERADAEAAEVAFRHAERQMKALEIQLSAAQTIAKSVGQMYGAAGSGRG